MNLTHASAFTLLCLGLTLGAIPGCAHNRAAAPPSIPPVFSSETPPDDFTLAVTVYARPGASRRTALPPERRPARYVLEPDWVLHAQVSPAANEQMYPGRTRQLDRAQVIELWRELRESGLTNVNHAAVVGRVPEPVESEPGAAADGATLPPVYAVSYTAGGIRRTLALQGGDESAAAPLVRRLAASAWIGR